MTLALASKRALPAIAVDILAAHNAFLASARSTLECARAAGDLLLDAKEQLRHGEWLRWLATNCPAISDRVAQGYMRIAREWSRLPETAVSYLPIRDALTILADEWTEPEVRCDRKGDRDDGHDDNKEGDKGDDPYTRTVRLLFARAEHDEFRRRIEDLKQVLNTNDVTTTVAAVVRLAHADLAAVK